MYRPDPKKPRAPKAKAGKIISDRTIKKAVNGKSIPQLVKELDTVFSLYIRLRGADKDGMVKCFTCGNNLHYTRAQCGHFHSRKYYSLRWNEINCQVQDVHCNIFSQGMGAEFATNLTKVHGVEILYLLQLKKSSSFKLEAFNLKYLVADYKKQVLQLKISNGLM